MPVVARGTTLSAFTTLLDRWCAALAAPFIALLALSASYPADAARRALVVGNDNYSSVAKLRNARADAEAMAGAFRQAGYEVDLVTDRNLKQLQADVRNFRQKVLAGDEIVVFFSGHGVQLGGTNYLLPTDVGAQNEDQVKDDALSLSSILEGLRERKPRFTLAIVDACRDNPFAGTGRAIGGRGLTGVAGASGQMVIYAAGEGQKALDRLGNNDTVRNGLFTRVFLKEIAKPGVPIRDVLYRVRDEVATLAEGVKHEQVPAVYDQVRGTFYFLAPALATPSDAGSRIASTAEPAASDACGPRSVLIRPGDTFIRIGLDAAQNWRDVQKWNGIENPNLIWVGQPIVVGDTCGGGFSVERMAALGPAAAVNLSTAALASNGQAVRRAIPSAEEAGQGPVALFSSAPGQAIRALAAGHVSQVENGTVVLIHAAKLFSIYKFDGIPSVRVGDRVSQSAILAALATGGDPSHRAEFRVFVVRDNESVALDDTGKGALR